MEKEEMGGEGKLIFKRVFSVRDTGCFNSAQEDVDLGNFLAKKYSNPLLSVGWVAFSHLRFSERWDEFIQHFMHMTILFQICRFITLGVEF